MVKQEVLAALDAARGRFISGQELAAQLGVSRTAGRNVNAFLASGLTIKAKNVPPGRRERQKPRRLSPAGLFSLSKNFIIKLRNNRPRLQKSKNIPQKLANKGVSTPSLQASSDSWQQI